MSLFQGNKVAGTFVRELLMGIVWIKDFEYEQDQEKIF